MKKTPKKIRLAAVFVDENTANKLKEIGDKEKRTMANQAAYVVEAWAVTVK
ncbi:MAG: hypothetical protein WCD70_14950 [Alphaproteobacteria bacterium]